MKQLAVKNYTTILYTNTMSFNSNSATVTVTATASKTVTVNDNGNYGIYGNYGNFTKVRSPLGEILRASEKQRMRSRTYSFSLRRKSSLVLENQKG